MVENIKPTNKLIFNLEMLQIDCNDEKKAVLRHEIAKKYGVPLKNVEVIFKQKRIEENGEKIALTDTITSDIQSPQVQLELFKEMLNIRGIKDIDFNDIVAIDSQVNALVDFDAYKNFKQYKFKYVKWDNYLSYGKGNYFDFTDLKGLVLLNGQPENQCGKTTFAIDLLRFALFGKAHKSPSLDSVFNSYLKEETEVMVEVGIEFGGEDYVIRRTITRPPLKKRTARSKCKQKVEFFKQVNGETCEIANLEDENGTQTSAVIKELVGDVEDFNLVISATAFSLGELLRLGQTDRSRLFSRWMGLLSIEKKEEIAKDIWKKSIQPSLIGKTYNRATLESEIKILKDNIENDRKDIITRTTQLEVSNGKIEQLHKDKIAAVERKKEVNAEVAQVDITTIENNIKAVEQQLEIERGKMRTLKEEYMTVKGVTYNADEHKAVLASIEKYKEQNTELRTNIFTLKEENKRVQTLMESKICPNCHQPVDAAFQTDTINKNLAKISELTQKGVNNKAEIDKLTAQSTKFEEDRDNNIKRQQLELRLTAIKTTIDNFRYQLNDLMRKKAEVEQNKENIRLNNEVMLQINAIDTAIRTETEVRNGLMLGIEATKNEITQFEKDITTRQTWVDRLIEEEKIIRNWEVYKELVGKNGISKIVLKRALPIINNEIARILQGLCDFKVEISISEDNGQVLTEFIHDGEHFDLGRSASGFEGVMSALAIRSALASVSAISKSNMLVLDEVLDGVAVSNYDNVRKLFERIVENYDFILHITHNELIADWHSQNVCVTKNEKNISRIELNKNVKNL